MECSDIRNKLQVFLDDLLTEQEYKEFCEHIDSCQKCRDYVRSVGNLSNQLWKLGKVRVPDDIIPTILFRLREQKQRIERIRFGLDAVIIILLFIILAIFFMSDYYRKNQIFLKSKKESYNSMPQQDYSYTQDIVSKTDEWQESRSFEEEMHIAEEDADKEEIISDETKTTLPTFRPSDVVEKVYLRDIPFHWHLRYSQKREGRLDLLDMLIANNIIPIYQKYGIIVFNSSGRNIEGLVEKILLTCEKDCSLVNFTGTVFTPPDKERRVSIYFEYDKTNSLHWHIDPIISNNKSYLLEILEKISVDIDYKSDEMIVLSVPNSEIKKLKAKIQATGASILEYGHTEIKQEDALLTSSPITISIYFTK
ncbi:MAG: zf-HC2 domain-containing protein [Candidatus Omnitrophica bacterium]|nr:zf-HC2 domain-containing protein [Candidatus Omnitrophota bacterium]